VCACDHIKIGGMGRVCVSVCVGVHVRVMGRMYVCVSVFVGVGGMGRVLCV